MSDFSEILSSVAGVYLVMVFGAAARRCGWLSGDADRSLASITANLFIPCLFMHRILTSSHSPNLPNALFPMLLGFGCTAGGYVIAWMLVTLFGEFVGLRSESQRRSFIACVGIANYTYIPLPIAEAMFPGSVVRLLVHNVGVDIAMWSLGIWVLCGNFKANWKRIVFGPPLLAMLVAYSAKSVGLEARLPDFVLVALNMAGSCAIPIGLMLGGAIIFDQASTAIQNFLASSTTILFASLIRQLLLPVAFILLAIGLALPQDLRQVLLLQAAMPCATFPIVLVRLYHQDVPTAVRVVVGTSMVGVITIPLWILAGKHWLLLPTLL